MRWLRMAAVDPSSPQTLTARRRVGRTVVVAIAITVALGGAGCAGAGKTSNTKVPPPLNEGPLAKPFRSTVLLGVDGASRVRVCFHIPAAFSAGCQVRAGARSCAAAVRLTKLPASYPVQKNLLSVFLHRVWSVGLPRGASPYGLKFVVTSKNAHWTTANSFTLY